MAIANFRARLSKFFKSANADAIVLFNGDASHGTDPNFRYFSGSSIDGSIFAAKRGGGAAFFTSSMNIARARAIGGWKAVEYGRDAYGTMRKFLGGKKKIAIDMRSVSAFRYRNMGRRLHAKLQNASEQMGAVRSFKDAAELDAIRKPVLAARKILDGLDPSGFKTELELHNALLVAAIEAGGTASFDPIVATGGNSAFPHHNATMKKLSGIVLVDYGIAMNGYCSDLTRCYFLGGCAKEKKAYETAQQVFYEIKDALGGIKDGRQLSAFAAGRNKAHGLPPLIHSIGHGIGLEVHEMPHPFPRSHDKIGEGTVMAIEPAAYYKSFGVRYEDELYLKNGKARMF